jgi:hypothetical protein
VQDGYELKATVAVTCVTRQKPFAACVYNDNGKVTITTS